MPPKSAPMTQVAMCRLIKESVDAAIAAERERKAKVRNDASGFGPARGQDTALAVRKCTFVGFMKCNITVFHGIKGAVELRRWFKKIESVFGISECAEGKKVRFVAATLEGPNLTWWNSKIAAMGFETVNRMPWTEMKQLMTAEFNDLALMCLSLVEPERVKVDTYIRGLTDNIKGEVTSSKPADLNEVVCMAYKLMEQKLQARNERILEGMKQKITKRKEMREPWLPLLLMDSFLCVNVVLLAMLVHVRSSATSVERLDTSQGHTRNRCPKKVKQEEVGEVRGRAYAIKDDEPQCPNVVTGTFLLNDHYASVLFDSGSDRSFFLLLVQLSAASSELVLLVKIDGNKVISAVSYYLRMEQYLTHTDYALWEVIVNDDAPAPTASASGGTVAPKTTEQRLIRKNELKAKSTLLLAITDEHLLKFYGIKDAQTLWEAIKTRFGGNKESKKMQKTILKQQYENFAASRSEGLDKTYDRFQKLISQLEIHGEVIPKEDSNLKLLRSLPPA
ncbi:hypothetical protein Tco_1028278 [Tanacetum coccineum]|uniref:Uncharacterized protein n=1 Tax=Tanacetum coccineum TaxID=301880 RepID=A0ABQ5G2C0_9ASTR